MTMPLDFHSRRFDARFGLMGDDAEAKFEELYTVDGKPKFLRFGFARPRGIQVWRIPVRLRHCPDYLQNHRFVECMGLGRKQVLRLKVEKLMSLGFWNALHPVVLFVWDSHRRRHVELPYSEIVAHIDEGRATLGHFVDGQGKAVFELPASVLFGEDDGT